MVLGILTTLHHVTATRRSSRPRLGRRCGLCFHLAPTQTSNSARGAASRLVLAYTGNSASPVLSTKQQCHVGVDPKFCSALTSAIAQLLAQEVIKLRREVAQLRAGGAGGAGDKDTQAQIQRLEVLLFIRPAWDMYQGERRESGRDARLRARDVAFVARHKGLGAFSHVTSRPHPQSRPARPRVGRRKKQR